MTPYYADDWLTVYQGDARTVLSTLPDESVHCVVTSPPYFGLRDYGEPGQIGLEDTVEQYVATMVDVFAEVRRVLRPDGTLWLNLGDSYAGSWGRRVTDSDDKSWHGSQIKNHPKRAANTGSLRTAGVKPKDLYGVPWRVAFALQADGWYLRSDIIWAKPNPMPESVTDRPTKSHEYLFLLARGQWKPRVVQPANGNGEGLHLGSDFWPTSAPVRLADADFCVRLAATILDSPEVQEKLRLPSLDAEVGQQGSTGGDRHEIGGLPVEHRAAVLAARLLGADCSTKEFLSELHRLGIALTDGHKLLIGGLEAEVPLPPGVSRYGEGTVAIHYPGEVRELDLRHGTIVASKPSTCSYYYDAAAVAEDARYSGPNGAQLSPYGQGFTRRSKQRATEHDFGVLQPFVDAGMEIDIHAPDSPPTWEERKARGATAGNIGASDTYQNGVHGEGLSHELGDGGLTRNLRSVWTVATQPYPGAHFATFPRKLVEPCIKAGCPEGGTVLDPFAGSGTTGMVAQSLSRKAILIDLNADYLVQAMGRNRDIPLGLVS